MTLEEAIKSSPDATAITMTRLGWITVEKAQDGGFWYKKEADPVLKRGRHFSSVEEINGLKWIRQPEWEPYEMPFD